MISASWWPLMFVRCGMSTIGTPPKSKVRITGSGALLLMAADRIGDTRFVVCRRFRRGAQPCWLCR